LPLRQRKLQPSTALWYCRLPQRPAAMLYYFYWQTVASLVSSCSQRSLSTPNNPSCDAQLSTPGFLLVISKSIGTDLLLHLIPNTCSTAAGRPWVHTPLAPTSKRFLASSKPPNNRQQLCSCEASQPAAVRHTLRLQKPAHGGKPGTSALDWVHSVLYLQL
jgi:hypothetical protein